MVSKNSVFQQFANVVSILIGVAVLVEAIKMLGGITIISNTLAAVKNVPIITVALMSVITFFAGIPPGSGNVSWYAFDSLVPDVTAQMGVFTAAIALPMQLSPGIGRRMSPAASVIIAISGMAELDIMDIVKGCFIPAVVMYICSLVISRSVV